MLPTKRTSDLDKDLTKARILSNKITGKVKRAGITKKDLEKDVHEAFYEIKKNRRSNRS